MVHTTQRCEEHYIGQDGQYAQCAEDPTYRVSYTYRGDSGNYTEDHVWCMKHFADSLRITAYQAETGEGEGWDVMGVTVI